MQLALRLIAVVSFIVAIIWVVQAGGFEPEPILAFLGGLTTLALSFINEKKEEAESLDQRNRRVMLNHVENFWVKGILEKSLHGAALLDLGIKDDPSAISYPWGIKRESTDETLPAGKSMLDIFEEIGAGRSLLILGAPGSGKTTMLLELARGLIEHARADETEPIPVIFNLASWTEKLSLADWLAEQLNIVYTVPKKTAPQWVAENKMLLLLDGLDEVRQDNRTKCAEAINQFRNEQGLTSLVVCSRIEEYSAVNTKLSLEGAITLQPLTSKQVNAYFNKFGESLVSVKEFLKKDKDLRELAETPLMLSIMTLAYKDKRPEELPPSSDKDEQRKHLFDAYINIMFERPTRITNLSFTKVQTLHYLSWLARKMVKHNIITYQIEAMQPSWLEKKSQYRLYRLLIGLIYILIFELSFGPLFGLLFGLLYSSIYALAVGTSFDLSDLASSVLLAFALNFRLIVGLILGLIGGLVGGSYKEIKMVDRLSWSWKRFQKNLIDGLLYGLGIGLIIGWIFLPSVGLIGGLTSGLIISLSYGLIGEQMQKTTRPDQHLKQTFSNVIFVIILTGILPALSVGLIHVLLISLRGGIVSYTESVGLGYVLIGGLSFGLVIGLFFGLQALIQHYTLRFTLIRNGSLPRQPFPFLDYAVDLIFLRRVGGSYIFVHRLLMEHFAEMDVEKP